jgi:hypothetical protein
LAWRRLKIRPEIIPTVAEDSGPNMSDSFSMVRLPTHAGLIEPDADDLLDGAFRRTTANLTP